MLKRLLLIVIVLWVLPAVTSADPIDEMVALAEHFPADTAFYVSVRADDDYITALDGILAELEDALTRRGGVNTSPVMFYQGRDDGFTPIQNTLDSFAAEWFGGDFATAIRPWLGDHIALGITDFTVLFEVGVFDNADDIIAEGNLPVILALELDDRAAAVETFDALLMAGDNTLRVDTGAYLYYQALDAPLAAVITPDALVFGLPDAVLNAVDSPQPPLLNTPDFNDTLALFTEPNYSAVAYIDYRQLMRGFTELAALDPAVAATVEGNIAFSDDVIDSVSGLAFGATLLDGRTLTLDIVQNADYTALAPLGLQYALPFRIDPNFAERLPAEIGLVLMGDDLAGLYDAAVENMLANARLQAESDILPEGALSASDIEGGLFLAQFMLRRYTGLGLQNDLLAWMDGDYALLMGLTAEAGNTPRYDTLARVPLEVGLVMDATTNPDAAASTVTGIGRGVDTLLDDFADDIDAMQIEVTRTDETIGGGKVIVYTAIDRSGFNFQFPIELMVGANEEMFVLGTRGVVAPVLRGEGGLRTTNAFTEAETAYLVDEAGVLLLANPDALMPLANFWAISDPFNPAAGEQAQVIRNVLGAFSSATISGSNRTDGSGVSRMTLSLNLNR